MTFLLKMPEPWASRGWKAKIRDRERVEPPPFTVLHRTRAWRIGLRDFRFLDGAPPPRDVPVEVQDFLEQNLRALQSAWDWMYPENPVEPENDDA